MTGDEGWPLRVATDGDRRGAAALLARSLPFDIVPGPFQSVDAADLLASCWDPADDGGGPATHVVRVVSEQTCGILPGADGVAVAVPAGIAIGSVARDRRGTASGRGPGSGTGPVGHLALLAVDPTARGSGLGRRLLRTLVDQLRAGGAGTVTTAGRPPLFGWPGADVRYTAFGLLAESEGFGAAARDQNMTVDLDAASRDGLLDTVADVERLAAAGVVVRRGTPADLPALLAAAAEFGGTWGAEAAQSLTRDPVAVHLALRGERVTGFACHATSRHGWLGRIGVSATERLGGLGAVLARRCLVDIRAEGRAQAQICWVGPVRFYARVAGGYVDRTFVRYAKAC